MVPEAGADRGDLASRMRARGVSPSIIERVQRLNPSPRLGERLRGIHYKDDPRWMQDLVPRGECIRRYGRSEVEGWPRSALVKFGRRTYVTRAAVEDFLPGAA